MEKDRKNLYINIVFILQGIKFKFKTGYPGKIHLLSPPIKFHHHPRVTKERKILSKTVDPHLQRFS